MKLKKKTIGDFEKFQLTGAHYIIGGGDDGDIGPGDKPDDDDDDDTIVILGLPLPNPFPKPKPKE